MKLIAMRGWPGSGKSRRAAEIATEVDGVIVNRDMLRKQLLGEWYAGNKEDEDRVTIAEVAQIEAFLKAGVNVIVDAQHVNPVYLRKWAKLATRFGAEFEVVDVRTDVSECKRRVYERWENEMGTPMARYIDPKVVEDQAKRFPQEHWPTITAQHPLDIKPVEWVDGLPEAIIVDIDGTVAHHDGIRSHYDYASVHLDVIDEHVRWLLHEIWNSRENPDTAIIIISGRDDTCEDATVEWLTENEIWFDEIHMRPTGAKDEYGNKLADYIVKYDLFNEHIRDKYNVRFVLDDRDQVVRLWRSLGLKCLQVAEGSF